MIIIPARIQSQRFPNKVLELIDSKPMVIQTALRASDIDKVLIATDSKEVIKIAKDFGIDAILTRQEHKSGTDRVNEAVEILGLDDDDLVINLQADEPFIEKEVLNSLLFKLKSLKDEDFLMASCYKRQDFLSSDDPNLVKLILDENFYAIYFSRSLIPYPREKHKDFFIHIGIYGFNVKSLKEFCSLPYSPLEDIEKLEQLRAIYYRKKISMVEVISKSFGIDTKEDLEKAKSIFLKS